MKRWEYQNIHLLLAPVYLRMVYWCLRNRVTPFGLLKANSGLDHGGATFASKYGIQMTFRQERFPPTILLCGTDSAEIRAQQLQEFALQHRYPVILKPDLGRIGFGVTLVHSADEAAAFLERVNADYLAQQYAPGPLEFGVFYVRQKGVAQIFAINSKEFPAVIGDGSSTVRTLLERHERLRRFQHLFNTTCFDDVPARGEEAVLSSVGSHTLGCVFRDVTALRTPAMLEAVDAAVGVEGFNFGRLDVRTSDVEALQRGEFTVIEVNGVESLATNAFDPDYGYAQGLDWFTRQFRLLVEIAAEHRAVEMERVPLLEFFRRVARAEDSINGLGSMLHVAPAAAKRDQQR
ncbi:MAG: hypothetical protein Cons2KO_13480 [Congregibacter sp.]